MSENPGAHRTRRAIRPRRQRRPGGGEQPPYPAAGPRHRLRGNRSQGERRGSAPRFPRQPPEKALHSRAKRLNERAAARRTWRRRNRPTFLGRLSFILRVRHDDARRQPVGSAPSRTPAECLGRAAAKKARRRTQPTARCRRRGRSGCRRPRRSECRRPSRRAPARRLQPHWGRPGTRRGSSLSGRIQRSRWAEPDPR